jgi:hexosaminidase
MPLPAHSAAGQGEFAVDGSFNASIEGYTDAVLVAGRQRFLDRLTAETGIAFARDAQAAPGFTIKAAGPSAAVEHIGEDESYRLEVDATHVRLTAANPLGVLHGLQTFLQLVRVTPRGFSIPAVTIDDQPRFSWRGLMIDVGRHFMPVEVIERNLDGMEAVKLNVFHWHLSDDQGFRVESKQLPLLQEKGSNGLYYTQKQIAEVVEYARLRGIRVVPEFDMPCHTSAILAAYPEIGSGPGPYTVADKIGILNAAMDPTEESTYVFIDKFIGEMAGLFPDAYFHVGGDECNGKEWKASPKIQAYIQEHGLKNNEELQAYFSGRVQKLVASHGKVMMGWDEVLQATTPREVVIQSWRGQKALAAAARQGNNAVLSTGYYIDLYQSAAKHYLVDPLDGDGATLTPEQKAHILGGEATMWSEYVTPENIDSRIWPRTAAIAERFWSPQEVRDVDSMYKRLAVVSQKLQYYGLQHLSYADPMLERMSGDPDPKYLRVLAAVVQPPEGYARGGMKNYRPSTPLNRLVDAVAPESETARKFNELAKTIAAGKASPQQFQEARAWLTLWRDNDGKLEPLLERSELTLELVPLSRSLAQTAAVGLEALDDLENHRTVEKDGIEKKLDLLKAAEKPQAVLIDKIPASVELLVRASAGQ